MEVFVIGYKTRSFHVVTGSHAPHTIHGRGEQSQYCLKSPECSSEWRFQCICYKTLCILNVFVLQPTQ
jgi:hypothetical protein